MLRWLEIKISKVNRTNWQRNSRTFSAEDKVWVTPTHLRGALATAESVGRIVLAPACADQALDPQGGVL